MQKDDLIVQVDGNRVDTCDVFLQVRSYREEGEERKGEERALSGWKDSRMSVQQHDCSTIPADFIIKMDNLIIKLLQSSVVGMDPGGRLWPLAKCIFATFLVYYSAMRIKCPNHPTLNILNEKCNECDIRVSVLLEWGVQIGNKFKMDNIKAVMHGGESLIPLLLERVVILENCVTSQKQVRIQIAFQHL